MIKCCSSIFMVSQFSSKKKNKKGVLLFPRVFPDTPLTPEPRSCAGSPTRLLSGGETRETLGSISPRAVVQPQCKVGKQHTRKHQQQLFSFHSVFRVDFSFKIRNSTMKMGSAFNSTRFLPLS